jgi:hypothetical protein
MATPVFLIKNKQLTEQNLYFIHDTYFELPLTIPIDLTTFIWYHIQTERRLDGLFESWEYLHNHQTSLKDTNFDTHFNDCEKESLNNDIFHSCSNVYAKVNKNCSDKLKIFIDNKLYISEDIGEYLDQLLKQHTEVILRNLKYYYSKHYLMDFIWQRYPKYTDTFDTENTLKTIYEFNKFPLYFIPHKLRSTGYFAEKCFFSRNDRDLIPEIKDEFSKNIEIVLRAVKDDGLALEFADIEFKKNKDIVIAALKSNKNAFHFVDNELKNETEIKQILMKTEEDLPF